MASNSEKLDEGERKPKDGPPDNPMESLLEQSEAGDQPKRGEIRKGVIARVTPAEILVSIGTKSEGVIPARELERLDTEARAASRKAKRLPSTS